MDKYELVVIMDAAVPQEEKETTVKEVGDLIAMNEGKVINSQVWLEKHKFSFRMKKKTEGTYYLVNFESPREKIVKLRQKLKLNEKVLRSLIVKP
ncbi:MAG: 30S ribosomal protein S6 [Candidatus Omnitrophica bacterium]|nr:30S ribosomal protein S6 [Candidatus Omnitrophota bacterium]